MGPLFFEQGIARRFEVLFGVNNMEYTLDEKYKLIKEEVLKNKSKNPIEIAKSIMHKDFVNIHGPEHHFLDGASFMVAYKNSSGDIDLDKAIDILAERTIKMPGAMCGYWGMCGSVSSVAAVLAIIHEVGPLSSTPYYGEDMEFTSSVIKKMSEIGGPRCCKRNAFLSLNSGAKFIKEKYGVEMELGNIECEFSSWNKQCIGTRCPFHKANTDEK